MLEHTGGSLIELLTYSI